MSREINVKENLIQEVLMRLQEVTTAQQGVINDSTEQDIVLEIQNEQKSIIENVI